MRTGIYLRSFSFATSRAAGAVPLSRRDVVLERSDHELLLLDNGPHDVANRHHTDNPAAFDHRQVTNPLVGHERHAGIDRRRRVNRNDVGGPEAAHSGIARCVAVQRGPAGVVALGEERLPAAAARGARTGSWTKSRGTTSRSRR